MPGTDIATTTAGSALAIRAGQSRWTDEQLAVVRQISAEDATTADLDLFFHQCARTGLDPFFKQIYLVAYGGRPTVQVGIDGFRVVARRVADASGESIEYEDIQWCGSDGQWTDVWLSPDPPAAARAVVKRGGRRFAHVAVFAEYVGRRKVYEGTKGNRRWTGRWEVNDQWTNRPAHMIGKCAEAGALRKAFPADLSGVYAPEELHERPEMVRGEIVRDDAPAQEQPAAAAPPPEEKWLELIAAATTRDELAGIWDQLRGVRLPVTVRAAVETACKQRAEQLQADAARDQALREQAVAAVQQLLEECGWIDHADQSRLAGQLCGGMRIGDWTKLPGHMLADVADGLREALASGDPQAWLLDYATHAQASATDDEPANPAPNPNPSAGAAVGDASPADAPEEP